MVDLKDSLVFRKVLMYIYYNEVVFSSSSMVRKLHHTQTHVFHVLKEMERRNMVIIQNDKKINILKLSEYGKSVAKKLMDIEKLRSSAGETDVWSKNR